MDVPRLYFVCPDTDAPSGGVRVIYRSVDHLREAGFDAVLVHDEPGFRCSWFESDTPIISAAEVEPVPGRDLIAIPEIYGPDTGTIAPGVAKVIFNQNAYNTFAGYEAPAQAFAYHHPEVIGAVCVSDDNADYLRHAFPDLWVRRITYQLDPELFHPAPKSPLITFMPRKNAQDVAQVLNLLAARGALDGFDVLPLHGLPERELAAVQRRSMMFLSFGYPEGCPFPPKEAMACGCLVVGYHGMGGRDYFTAENGFPVAHGDVVAFAATVEDLLERWRRDPAPLQEFALSAAARIAARYTPQAERDSTVALWSDLLARAATVTPTPTAIHA